MPKISEALSDTFPTVFPYPSFSKEALLVFTLPTFLKVQESISLINSFPFNIHTHFFFLSQTLSSKNLSILLHGEKSNHSR